MDPNATLTDIRNMVANITSGWLDESRIAAEAGHLAEAVSSLDEWLSKGGHYPDAWEEARR